MPIIVLFRLDRRYEGRPLLHLATPSLPGRMLNLKSVIISLYLLRITLEISSLRVCGVCFIEWYRLLCNFGQNRDWELDTVTLSNFENRRVFHKTPQEVLDSEDTGVCGAAEGRVRISRLQAGHRDRVLAPNLLFRLAPGQLDTIEEFAGLYLLTIEFEDCPAPQFEFKRLDADVAFRVI